MTIRNIDNIMMISKWGDSMKFRVRLKIAYDMCIKQLFTFRISTILFAITLTIFGIIIYQYKASYNYRLMVEK